MGTGRTAVTDSRLGALVSGVVLVAALLASMYVTSSASAQVVYTEALGAAATRVRLARPLPGMALGEPRVIGGTAWAGDAPGWEGTLQLEIDLLLAADVAPGPRRLALEVVVQPCDDRGTCLLPATLELPLALRVGEAEGPARHPGRFPDPGVPAHQGGDARDG